MLKGVIQEAGLPHVPTTRVSRRYTWLPIAEYLLQLHRYTHLHDTRLQHLFNHRCCVTDIGVQSRYCKANYDMALNCILPQLSSSHPSPIHTLTSSLHHSDQTVIHSNTNNILKRGIFFFIISSMTSTHPSTPVLRNAHSRKPIQRIMTPVPLANDIILDSASVNDTASYVSDQNPAQ